jgi:quercetin dioxygenase-like cupin family protein
MNFRKMPEPSPFVPKAAHFFAPLPHSFAIRVLRMPGLFEAIISDGRSMTNHEVVLEKSVFFYLKEFGMRLRNIVAVAMVTLLSVPVLGDEHEEGITLNPPDKIEWKVGPPSLPHGAQIAVLEGDPSKEGPFVFRIKVPDGYRIPVHTHPKTERVTVISGTFNIGMGETFDEKATKPMIAGTYGFWEADMKHFVWIKGETIIQFHGTGPWKIEYVSPKDDPRNKNKASK